MAAKVFAGMEVPGDFHGLRSLWAMRNVAHCDDVSDIAQNVLPASPVRALFDM